MFISDRRKTVTGLLPALFGCVLLASMSLRSAEAQLPTDLEFLLTEAQEALFDGHYDQIDFYTGKIQVWLDQDPNKALLASRGFHWGLTEGLNALLVAQACLETGDLRGVDRETKRAMDRLEQVRLLRMQGGDPATTYWALGVLVENMRAERHRPRRMFLEMNEQFQFVRPFHRLNLPLPGVIAFLEEERQASKKSAMAYKHAREVVERHLVPAAQAQGPAQGMGQAQGGGETQLLSMRVLYSFYIEGAKQSLYREGVPMEQNYVDAIAMCERAFEYADTVQALAGDTVGVGAEDFFPESAQVPVSYKAFSNLVQPESNAEQMETKKAWSMMLREWARLFVLNAELVEYLGLRDQNALAMAGNRAERDPIARQNSYVKAAGFLLTHFEPDHPLVIEMERSRTHILLTRLFAQADELLADKGVPAAERELKAIQAVSRARDCLLELYKLRQHDIDRSPSGRGASLVKELRIIETLARLDVEFRLLSDAQKQECRGRITAVDAELAEIAKEF